MYECEEIEALLGVDAASLDDAGLSEAVLRLVALSERVQAASLLALGEWDARGCWAEGGFLSAGQWLVRHSELPGAEARGLVAAARSIRSTSLVAPAMAKGGLTAYKAKALAKVRTPRTEELFDEHEQVLVQEAARLSADDTIRLANRWQQMADTEGEAPDDDDQSARMSPTYGGRWRLDANFCPEGGAIFSQVLDQICTALFRSARDDGLPRPSAARLRADALVEMARRATAARDERASARPLVVVRMELDDLIRRAGWPVMTDRGTVLSWQSVRRLLCDADVCRVVMNGPSEVIDVGRGERSATAAQRRALLVRDGGCTFPGCDRPPGWCEAHHIEWWENGGSTDLSNLCLLCSRHHHAVHKGSFSVRRDLDGQLVFANTYGWVLDCDPRAGRSFRPPEGLFGEAAGGRRASSASGGGAATGEECTTPGPDDRAPVGAAVTRGLAGWG